MTRSPDRPIERVRVVKKGGKIVPTWGADTTVGPIISENQARRMEGILAKAAEGVAELLERVAHRANEWGVHFIPTILGLY